jgi:hypothetical protein
MPGPVARAADPAHDAEIGADLPGWRPVRKRIRRFTAAGGQSQVPIGRRGEQPSCEVELTEIHAGGRTWWTLGLEATGPASQLRTQLEATAALVFAQVLPGGMELGTDHSQSYAQWLTGGGLEHGIVRRHSSTGLERPARGRPGPDRRLATPGRVAGAARAERPRRW